MWVFFSLILFSGFTAPHAALAADLKSSGQNCTTADLTHAAQTDGGGNTIYPFSQMRDQHSSNLCFAFSSADVFSQLLGQPVSELYIALLTNRDRVKSVDAGKGRVSGSGLSFGDSALSSLYAQKDAEVCIASSLPFATFDKIKWSIVSKLKSLKTNSQNDASSIDAKAAKALRKIFPALTDQQLYDIGQTYTGENENAVMFAFAHAQCANTGGLRTLPMSRLTIGSIGANNPANNPIEVIDQGLDLGRVVRVDVFQRLYLASGTGEDSKMRKQGHSITAIARKMSRVGCLYKFRDSDLSTCFDNAYDCNVNKGTYWIDEKTLASTIVADGFVTPIP